MATKRPKAKPPKPDTRLVDRVRSLNQRHSKREIGRMLGVDDRTVRRWLSGETKKPAKLKEPETQKALTRELAKDRKEATREHRKEHIPKLGVDVPPPARRITYAGEAKPSKTVEYGIRQQLVSSDAFKMLRNYIKRQRRKGEHAIVRFMGLGTPESLYPGEVYWSEWRRITDFDDNELDEFLEDLNSEFEHITKIRIDV